MKNYPIVCCLVLEKSTGKTIWEDPENIESLIKGCILNVYNVEPLKTFLSQTIYEEKIFAVINVEKLPIVSSTEKHIQDSINVVKFQ